MTVSAFDCANNLHDSTIERLEYFPDKRIAVLTIDFAIWFQGWFVHGMPENGYLLAVFENVGRVRVPDGFTFSDNTVYLSEYRDGALRLFCGWHPDAGEDYGEIAIEAESVSVQILPHTPASGKAGDDADDVHFVCQAERAGEKKTADYLAEERFEPGDLVVVQAGENQPEELAKIIAVARGPRYFRRNPKRVLRVYREGEPLWKPLRSHPMRGYFVYEEGGSSDPAFERYFSLVREKAQSLNSVFFLQAGDGHELEEDDMQGEDLWGWLIPISLADRFENLWAHGYREGDWDEDYYCHAEWRRSDDGRLEIRFIEYGEDGEPDWMRPEASFRTFYRVVFPHGSQEYTYLGGDTDYEIGDRVVVPAGQDNHEAVVEIVGKEKKPGIDAPYPMARLKTILRAAEPEKPPREEIAEFHITAEDLHWLTEDEAEDYCLHGRAAAAVGGYEISYDSVTVSAAALMLLRTLTEDHEAGRSAVGMLPCCGRPLPPMDSDPEHCILITCPNGADWSVRHDGEDVILDIGDEDGCVFRVPLGQYQDEVCRFADEIEAFYRASKPKKLPEDPDCEEDAGYEAFLREWRARRDPYGPGVST
ncbi:MAG: hypothetical protein IKQ92_03185 [Clostridia bacterium]|nr:hypothetical protein [Clostridia bacterium]